MIDPDRAIWQNLLAHLRNRHPGAWRQWFEEIEPITLNGGLFRLRVANPVQLKYLERECARAFADAAQEATGRLVTVRFFASGLGSELQLAEAGTAASGSTGHAGKAAPMPTGNGVLTGRTNGAAGHSSNGGERRGSYSDELTLIPDNSFDQFVVGPNNRFAHAAAVAVAENPGKVYNPVFIHGDVGLGKTHLLQAICQRILEKNPAASILYISCEDFITRFIEGVKAGQMSDFREHFRTVDVLVIDDIHFLVKRERSQDEFFHTFNTLYQSQRQIILSSDEAPDHIPHLEDRLVSRFKWGLEARVDPPDYETRVAIVQQKARVRGMEIPDEVANLIAGRFDSNIRQLEGAITQVQHLAHMDGVEITEELAREALGVEHAPPTNRATIETIVDAVTDYYGVSLAALQSKRRQRSIAQPRQVCMYLARKLTRYSLEEIGGYFGGRDHTTVLHAVRLIKSHRENGLYDMPATLEVLESKLATGAGANVKVNTTVSTVSAATPAH